MKKIINSHYFKLVISAMFAGLIMAVAGFELVVANNKNLYFAGGFIQGFGLLAVLFLGLELFNCKIVGIFDSKDKSHYALDLLITLVVNLLTVFCIALLLRVVTADNESLMKSAEAIATSRIITIKGSVGKEWYDALISALMCGFIIGIGVGIYKRVSNPIIKFVTIILAVGVYVACGFEQIMTNTFYVTFADKLDGSTILDLFIVLIGNSVACILVHFAFKLILPTNKVTKK